MSNQNIPQPPAGADGTSADQTTKHWYDLSIFQALSIAIIISVLIAGVGVSIYLRSNGHKYDINRPGGKYNAPQLTITEDTAIDTSSPVDVTVINGEAKMVQKQLDQLSPYGDYSDKGLSDAALGLTKPSEPTKQ